MSELETENGSAPTELITQEVAPTETGTTESGPELATGTAEGQEQPNQDAVNKAIGKQHAKYREEQRLRQASDDKLAEANRKLAEFEANKPAPSMPTMPDQYDDDFEAKMQVYNTAVVSKANHDAQQTNIAKQQQVAQQNAAQAEQERSAASVKTYRGKTVASGFDDAVMAAAENSVVNYGIKSDHLQYIIEVDDGSIMQHLAANPMDLDDLSRMNPMQAGVYINSTLTEKAKAFKHKPSNAPAPLETLNGNGVDPDGNKHPALKGVTYS